MNSFEKSSLQLSLVLRIGPTRQSACNVFYRWMSNNTRAFNRERASLAVWKKNWLKPVQTIITLTLVRNGIKYLQSRMWWALALSWRCHYIETSPLIWRANHWTGFYMIMASVMKELNYKLSKPFSIHLNQCKSIRNLRIFKRPQDSSAPFANKFPNFKRLCITCTM